MDLNDYRESLEKQNSGTPIYVGDAVFYCKRWGTPDSVKFLRGLRIELFGPTHKHQIGDDELLLAEWLCAYGVTNWADVFVGEEELIYSQQNARKVFLNPEYRHSLNQILLNECAKFENYLHEQAEADEEEAKKSLNMNSTKEMPLLECISDLSGSTNSTP